MRRPFIKRKESGNDASAWGDHTCQENLSAHERGFGDFIGSSLGLKWFRKRR